MKHLLLYIAYLVLPFATIAMNQDTDDRHGPHGLPRTLSSRSSLDETLKVSILVDTNHRSSADRNLWVMSGKVPTSNVEDLCKNKSTQNQQVVSLAKYKKNRSKVTLVFIAVNGGKLSQSHIMYINNKFTSIEGIEDERAIYSQAVGYNFQELPHLKSLFFRMPASKTSQLRLSKSLTDLTLIASAPKWYEPFSATVNLTPLAQTKLTHFSLYCLPANEYDVSNLSDPRQLRIHRLVGMETLPKTLQEESENVSCTINLCGTRIENVRQSGYTTIIRYIPDSP